MVASSEQNFSHWSHSPARKRVEERDFLPPEREAKVFWRLRGRLLAAFLRHTFQQARLRSSLVLVLTGILWSGMFWLFHDGFHFLEVMISDPGTHARAVSAVFSAFFGALMLMLIFSSAIILYGSLFRSREVGLLLTLPARDGRIFLYKFQEALVLTSWGFVLLGSPIILAYGVVAEAPWFYYVFLPGFVIGFIYIPVALGAIACLLVMHYFPANRTVALVAASGVVLGLIVWVAWGIFAAPRDDLLTPGWFQEILNRLQISDQRLLPSWWLSAGLLEAAEGAWSESILFLGVMLSNALFFRQAALWTAQRLYRPAYNALSDFSRRRRRPRRRLLDALGERMFAFLPARLRLLMVKDMRIFRRDPLQWSQFLIFFGLLAIYFSNIRRFTYDIVSIGWVNMVSFLNLAVVGLLLSTFTTRFIYPMISLEGRRFWFLGLLGVPRRTILFGKFLFAAVGSILPCSGLVLFSDLMLGVSLPVIASHQLTCLVLCFGLAGLAVGLGACLPNLREESPSRIAAGFGGTLCLVLSTLYILIVVMLTALPTHFHLAAEIVRSGEGLEQLVRSRWWLSLWWLGGTGASLVLGAIATFLPLRFGFRAFERMEF